MDEGCGARVKNDGVAWGMSIRVGKQVIVHWMSGVIGKCEVRTLIKRDVRGSSVKGGGWSRTAKAKALWGVMGVAV